MDPETLRIRHHRAHVSSILIQSIVRGFLVRRIHKFKVTPPEIARRLQHARGIQSPRAPRRIMSTSFLRTSSPAVRRPSLREIEIEVADSLFGRANAVNTLE